MNILFEKCAKYFQNIFVGGTFVIKGCNKRVIVMKETGNAMIEEAIFILKSGGGKDALSEADILRHANSILDKNGYAEKPPRFSALGSKKRKGVGMAGFFAGAFTGALAVVLITMLL